MLYPLAYALKFASKQDLGRDYVVPPLEGLWSAQDMAAGTAVAASRRSAPGPGRWVRMWHAADCEQVRSGLLGQPANAVSASATWLPAAGCWYGSGGARLRRAGTGGSRLRSRPTASAAAFTTVPGGRAAAGATTSPRSPCRCSSQPTGWVCSGLGRPHRQPGRPRRDGRGRGGSVGRAGDEHCRVVAAVTAAVLAEAVVARRSAPRGVARAGRAVMVGRAGRRGGRVCAGSDRWTVVPAGQPAATPRAVASADRPGDGCLGGCPRRRPAAGADTIRAGAGMMPEWPAGCAAGRSRPRGRSTPPRRRRRRR